MSLTPQQEAFACAYVETGSATEAYERAYDCSRMKRTTIYPNASRLLAHSKVAARIEELTKAAAERAGITKERWFRELAALSFSSLDDVQPWNEQGIERLIPSAELPREKRVAVKTMKTKRERQVRGRGEDADVWEVEQVEVTMHDKKGALDTIGKAMGWSIEKLEHSGPDGGPLEVESVERIIADPETARAARLIARTLREDDAEGATARTSGQPGKPR